MLSPFGRRSKGTADTLLYPTPPNITGTSSSDVSDGLDRFAGQLVPVFIYLWVDDFVEQFE